MFHNSSDPLLTPEQAASRLGLSTTYLSNLRAQGRQGPAFVKKGRAVFYLLSDLETFDRQRTARYIR